MMKRRDTHCHVVPCVHDEALLFGANERAEHFSRPQVFWLFDGP